MGLLGFTPMYALMNRTTSPLLPGQCAAEVKLVCQQSANRQFLDCTVLTPVWLLKQQLQTESRHASLCAASNDHLSPSDNNVGVHHKDQADHFSKPGISVNPLTKMYRKWCHVDEPGVVQFEENSVGDRRIKLWID